MRTVQNTARIVLAATAFGVACVAGAGAATADPTVATLSSSTGSALTASADSVFNTGTLCQLLVALGSNQGGPDACFSVPTALS